MLDTATGEEVASLAGKFQPAVLAAHAHALGKWYNHAAILWNATTTGMQSHSRWASTANSADCPATMTRKVG